MAIDYTGTLTLAKSGTLILITRFLVMNARQPFLMIKKTSTAKADKCNQKF
jgi:hypothetical protein